ncbi:hypothetical protein [Lentzea jiangxiensis]|uniref:hypothetical protein n=1 Tax=Lentzea jiangxiensis TaxID=641025 RepID=UPI00115F81B1|nr:hypothetical protein [Lentzea jiangxiensis]
MTVDRSGHRGPALYVDTSDTRKSFPRRARRYAQHRDDLAPGADHGGEVRVTERRVRIVGRCAPSRGQLSDGHRCFRRAASSTVSTAASGEHDT